MTTHDGATQSPSRSSLASRDCIVEGLFESRALARMLIPLLVLALSGCVNADWQNRLFGKGHGSATADEGLTASGVATLKAKWRLQPPSCTAPAGSPPGAGAAGGEWFATPVTFKGVIYIGSAHGCLFAINEATGTVRWKKFTAGLCCHAHPRSSAPGGLLVPNKRAVHTLAARTMRGRA